MCDEHNSTHGVKQGDSNPVCKTFFTLQELDDQTVLHLVQNISGGSAYRDVSVPRECLAVEDA